MEHEELEKREQQAWGQAPWPLVPAALRKAAGELPAPASLSRATGSEQSLADLDGSFWSAGHELGKPVLDDLIRCLTPLLREHAGLVLAAGTLEMSVPVAALGLAPRTQRAFTDAFENDCVEPGRLTFGELLEISGVGPKRTLELACAVEALIEAAEPTEPARPVPPSFDATTTVNGSFATPRMPREITTFFRVLAAWAVGERGEQTLRNALPSPKLGWPPELVQLWKRVTLCSAPELAGSLRERYSVPRLVGRAFEGCRHEHRIVLRARVLTSSRPTAVESLAEAMGLAEDDVRRLQLEASAFLERLQTSAFRPVVGRARVIRERIGVAVPASETVLELSLEWAVSDFDRSGDLDFARSLMLWLAGPYRLVDGWYVTAADLPERSTQALMRQRNHAGLIRTPVVREVLSSLAIHPKYHEKWVDRLGEFVTVAGGLMSSAERITGPLPNLQPPDRA